MKESAYLLQAAIICVWWAGLAFDEKFFNAFQFDKIPRVAFWAFFAPDIALIACLSGIRGYAKIPSLELVVLGAFGYAALYCLNATVLTHSGYLPTGLMLLGFAYNAFLCFGDSAFRTNKTSVKRNAFKTLIQIVCIWTVSLAIIPLIILDAFGGLTSPNGIWLSVGGICFACCSGLGLASAFYMVRDGEGTPLPLDQTRQLVVSGPYRFVRNPMAIAGIGQGISIAIIFQSWGIFIYAMLGAVVWHCVVRPTEEANMAKRFGQPYSEYRKRVGCWLPTFRRSD